MVDKFFCWTISIDRLFMYVRRGALSCASGGRLSLGSDSAPLALCFSASLSVSAIAVSAPSAVFLVVVESIGAAWVPPLGGCRGDANRMLLSSCRSLKFSTPRQPDECNALDTRFQSCLPQPLAARSTRAHRRTIHGVSHLSSFVVCFKLCLAAYDVSLPFFCRNAECMSLRRPREDDAAGAAAGLGGAPERGVGAGVCGDLCLPCKLVLRNMPLGSRSK